MEDSYTCHKCSMRIKYKRNLIRHEKTCDNPTSKTGDQNRAYVTCPKCKLIFGRVEHLRRHVAEAHDVSQEVENIKFLVKKDFEIWKSWIEKENHCFYGKKRSTFEKGIKRNYFYCHRSGFFESRSTGVRRLKKQGTNKIDATCTSTMTVIEYTDCIDVTFHKTHFGHNCSPPTYNPKTKKRSKIAKKTSEGVSMANNHKLSKEMDSNNIVKTSETTWEIPSSSHNNVTYEVTIVSGSCIEDLPVNRDDVDEDDQKIPDIIHQLDTAKDILIANEYTVEELNVIEKEANNLLNLITKKMTKSELVETQNNELVNYLHISMNRSGSHLK